MQSEESIRKGENVGSTRHRHKDNKPEKENRKSGKGSCSILKFPLIRRTFPDLIANEMWVQPMKGPVGLAYGLRFSYSPVPEFDLMCEMI